MLELIPAYGRDYKSGKAAKADWDAGKDFQHPLHGYYVNKADAPKGTHILRFNALRSLTTVKVK